MQLLRKLKSVTNSFLQYSLSALIVLLVLTYPFLIYFGLYHFEPWVLYTVIGGLIVGRFALRIPRLDRYQILRILGPVVAVGLFVVLGIVTNNQLYMLFLPALVTVSLAGVFGYTLYSGPSMIETLARMEVADLTDEDVTYCWNVTLAWIIFFLANSLLVVFLALGANREVSMAGYDPLALWAIYTGFVSYALIGVLFGVEFLFRKWKFRRYQGSLLDRILREIMPPRGNVIKTFVDLDILNVHTRRSNYPVAREDGDIHSWSEFNDSVAGLMERLCETKGDKWVLSCESGFSFMVGLFGIWQSNGMAVIPPNERTETLSSVLEDAHGVVTDRPGTVEAEQTIQPLGYSGSYSDLRILDPETADLRLFSSGSTGDQKTIPKSLAHLQEEVRVLEENWSDRLGNATVVATVSHQHIYGLLHKGLWPLSAGRVFEVKSVMYPDRLIETIRDRDSAALVTTPTHLESFVEHEEFSSLKSALRVIFSSGGPLSKEIADRIHARLGQYPFEILGSTETGGVAWRRQTNNDENLWKPFDRVKVEASEEGTLRVNSPWVSVPSSGWHDMRDYVSLEEDGRFRLEGRADRVENIAEKRVDLAEVEKRTTAIDRVKEAAAVVVEENSRSTSRRRMRLAVVPDRHPDGNQAEPMKERIRNRLLEFFEPVIIPRDILLVESLPRNDQGKVTVKLMNKLVEQSEAPEQ